mmetsp:Transcript_87632/g.155091  ORF Transcript_87632/g.155091 Transcript_87632/m.155091 type:complete len:397 (+) Transcript_87632:81-1271(+)
MSYQLGFQVTPLTTDGQLDTSGDFTGGPHPAVNDTLYKLACENRDLGNKKVKDGDYQGAIAQYSEMIMQTRALDNEVGIEWTDDDRKTVRLLRAAAYLNLSLCFLKSQQWTHAINTATRAMQGDKEPPVPEEDVLAPEKKAKALFRRAQAHCEGFGNFDKARDDLKAALKHSPEDKAVQQELKKVEIAVAKVQKKADKKMSGFLSSSKQAKSGEGIFDDSLRPSDEPDEKPKPVPEVKKLKEGLWWMPKDESQAQAEEQGALSMKGARVKILASGRKASIEEFHSTAEKPYKVEYRDDADPCFDWVEQKDFELDADEAEHNSNLINYEEIGREVMEMREDNPELYKETKKMLKKLLEDEAALEAKEQAAEEAEDKSGDAKAAAEPVAEPAAESAGA